MKEGLIKDIYEHIMKEIQSFITLLYIFMIGFGMLFNYQKYSEFGINIFEYADIFDFLIAPFQDYRIVLFSLISLISLIIPILTVFFDVFWRKKFPKSYSKANLGLDKKKWYNNFRVFSFALIFISYVYISADMYGKFNKKSTENKEEITITFANNGIKKGILIGKTEEYIFFKKNSTISAIPIASLVKEIEIKQ